MWVTWSEVVACSGSLSSLSRRRRGNRMLMPRSGSWGILPTAALWTGDFDRSAHFTSHTCTQQLVSILHDMVYTRYMMLYLIAKNCQAVTSQTHVVLSLGERKKKQPDMTVSPSRCTTAVWVENEADIMGGRGGGSCWSCRSYRGVPCP